MEGPLVIRTVAGNGDQHPPQGPQVAPEVALVPHVHRVALPAFHRGRHVVAADGILHHGLGLLHAEAVAGQLLPVPVHIQKIAAGGPLSEHGPGPLDGRQKGFDPGPDLLDGVEVRTGDL
jgi:hypothetical protein